MGTLGRIAAQRIREAREAAGLTQVELSDYLGITRDAVSKIENGRSTLTLQHLEQLPKILNRPIEYFLGLDTGLTSEEEYILGLFRALPEETPLYRILAREALDSLLRTVHQWRAGEVEGQEREGEG